MKPTKTQTVHKNIIAGFALIIILFILAGFVTFIEINILGNLTTTIYSHPLEVSNASLRATMGVVSMHRALKDIVSADEATIEKLIILVKNEEAKVFKDLDIIRNQILGEEGQDLEKEARALFINCQEVCNQVIILAKDGVRGKAAQIATEKGENHVSLLEKKMLALTSYARNKADTFFNESSRVQSRVTLSIIFIIGAGVLLSLVIAYVTFRQILKSVNKVREADLTILKEQKFTQKAIDSQWDTFFIFEIQTDKAIRWNKRFEEISGYNNEEIAAMKAPDSYYSDADLKRAAAKIEEVLKSGLGKVEMSLISKDGKKTPTEYIATTIDDEQGNAKYIIAVGRDITERKLAEEEREKLIEDLQMALNEIKTLEGIIPICMHCKEIRDDEGYWNQLESYITKHSEAQFSHCICDKCLKKIKQQNP